MAMSKDNRDVLVGLDIGTSKVVALVAELAPDGQFNVVGVGQTASKGLKKGVVVNIEATVQSIQKALEEAAKSFRSLRVLRVTIL
jgi:cell division protein FtsA